MYMSVEILGINGPSAGGKDTAGNHLAGLGYLHLATGDVIRQEAIQRYGTEEQRVLRMVGHELRQERGPGAICSAAIDSYRQRADEFCGVVVSGMRAVEAAKVIREESGLLVYIDAPVRMRYDRLVGRDRPGEPTCIEDFEVFEQEELAGQLTTGQNLLAIRAMSDVYVENVSDRPSFLAAIEAIARVQPVAAEIN